MTNIYNLNYHVNANGVIMNNHFRDITKMIAGHFLPAPAKSIDKYNNAYVIQIGSENGR